MKCKINTESSWIIGVLSSCQVSQTLNEADAGADGKIEITSVNGQTTPTNIEQLVFREQTIKRLPKGLGKFFPSLKVLKFEFSALESLEQSDLSSFKFLKALYLQFNNIEKLEEGLFEYNPELWNVNFSDNKIKSVGVDLLKSLKKLTYACFNRNKCINMDFNSGLSASGVSRNTLEMALNSDCAVNKEQFEYNLFENYLLEYDVIPRNRFERAKFKDIFLKNYYEIQEHNKRYKEGLESDEMGVNQFAHFTFEQLDSMFSRTKEAVTDKDCKHNEIGPFKNRFLSEIPEELDWEKEGAVRSVQDQGINCGSCYVFASIGALEGALSVTHGIKTKLSEQEAAECSNKCSGGQARFVYDYLKTSGGAAYAADHPYNHKSFKECNTTRRRVPKSAVLGWEYICKHDSLLSSEEILRHALIHHGPLFVKIEATKSFMKYPGGIHKGKTSESSHRFHAILLGKFVSISKNCS